MHVTADAETIPAPAKWRGPCAAEPTAWDLDAGDLGSWLRAQRLCSSCPFLTECRISLLQSFPDASVQRPSKNPKSVVWAGLAYSDTGRVMSPETLRRYASQRQAQRRAVPALAPATGTAGTQRRAS